MHRYDTMTHTDTINSSSNVVHPISKPLTTLSSATLSSSFLSHTPTPPSSSQTQTPQPPPTKPHHCTFAYLKALGLPCSDDEHISSSLDTLIAQLSELDFDLDDPDTVEGLLGELHTVCEARRREHNLVVQEEEVWDRCMWSKRAGAGAGIQHTGEGSGKGDEIKGTANEKREEQRPLTETQAIAQRTESQTLHTAELESQRKASELKTAALRREESRISRTCPSSPFTPFSFPSSSSSFLSSSSSSSPAHSPSSSTPTSPAQPQSHRASQLQAELQSSNRRTSALELERSRVDELEVDVGVRDQEFYRMLEEQTQDVRALREERRAIEAEEDRKFAQTSGAGGGT
ncbi:hypothetical protein C0991_008977 [Blastosporella zonata]|nr:hypothetical protein C0991_008977 [Blastosporella zonata]